MNNIVNVEIRTCETVVAEIRATIASVNQTAILGSITVGRNLQELKELVPHGQWGTYIEENLNFSERKAQQFMQIADNYGDESSEFSKAISKPHICADLSFSNALRLLALPEEEVEAFVEEHDVSSMKVAELEEEIRKLKESNMVMMDESDHKEFLELQAEKEKLLEQIAELERAEIDSEINISEVESKEAEIGILAEALEKKKKAEDKLKEKIQAMEAEKEEEISRAKEDVKKEARVDAEKEVKDKLEAMRIAIDTAENRASTAENKLSNMSNEDFATFKVKVTLLQETFNGILDSIENIKQSDVDQAKKLSAALGKLMTTLMERVG